MKTTAALALTSLVLATTAACGSASGPGTQAGPTTTPPRSTSASATSSSATTGIPSPDAAQTAKLLPQLAAIVPALTGPTDEDAVTRARNTCQTLLGVGGEPDPAGAARYLIASAAADSIVVDQGQAEKVLTVIETTFCPTP